MKARTILGSALLCLGLSVAANAAEAVVLAASGADLEPGSMIEGTDMLSLGDGARLTLVSQAGQVLELEGPWEGVPFADAGRDAGDSDLLGAVTQLVRGGGDSAAPGAFRSAGGSEGPPTADLIDTGRNGHYCVAGDALPTLWREDSEDEAQLKIRQADTGDRGEVYFEEEEATAVWPEELPPVDGASYVVRWADGAVSRQLTVHLMRGGASPSGAQRIVWMLQNDCVRQAELLLAAVSSVEQ